MLCKSDITDHTEDIPCGYLAISLASQSTVSVWDWLDHIQGGVATHQAHIQMYL